MEAVYDPAINRLPAERVDGRGGHERRRRQLGGRRTAKGRGLRSHRRHDASVDYDSVGGNKHFEHGCCTVEDRNDARVVAGRLGIPYYIVDFREEFEQGVISNFVSEYMQGRTPNPCVACNSKVKFGVLLDRARELGAEYVATGHYAG